MCVLIVDAPLNLLIPTNYILFIYSNLTFPVIVNGALAFTWKANLIMVVHKQRKRLQAWKYQHKYLSELHLKKNFMAPFYGWDSATSRLQSYYEEKVCFLPPSPQIFLVLIWSTSEGWKAELTLDPTSGFELMNPRLGIEVFNH